MFPFLAIPIPLKLRRPAGHLVALLTDSWTLHGRPASGALFRGAGLLSRLPVRLRHGAAVTLLSCGFTCGLSAEEDDASLLQTARQVASRSYNGWTYGARAQERQVDCVQFLGRVLSEALGRPLDSNERKAVYINQGWTAEEVQTKALHGEDPRIAGAVHALVDLMQVAERVDPEMARPGDVIQYWKRDGTGRWFGHAAILSEVTPEGARLYGSHRSTNGIAESDFRLQLKGDDRHVYLARLQEGAADRLQVCRDGVLWLSRRAGGEKEGGIEWQFDAPRWGMYRLQAHGRDNGEDGTALSISEVILDGKEVDRPSGETEVDAAVRLYLPSSGAHTLMVTCSEVPQAVSLTPAPEGNQDLAEVGGQVVLNARDATVWGQRLRYEPNPKKLCLGFWTETTDWAEWHFTLEGPGTFVVEVDQGCGTGQGGSQAYIEAAGQRLPFTVEDTGHFQNFISRNPGRLTFSGAGPHRLRIGAETKAGVAVMDVREVRLRRVNAVSP